MEIEQWCTQNSVLQGRSLEVDITDTAVGAIEFLSICRSEPLSDNFPELDDETTPSIGGSLHLGERPSSPDPPPTLAEFIEKRFIPEYVSSKRLAGRAHFQAILKHILTPKLVNGAFGTLLDPAKAKLREVPGWPYLDSFRLDRVTHETIQRLVSTAIRSGYSAQTVAHIRNVACAIFGYAIKVGVLNGTNPAKNVALPAMSRKTAHALTLSQVTQMIGLMGYPEREIALFLMLTDLNVAEICGLRWKDLNISPYPQFGPGFRIPSRTIVVLNQSYRGEFRPVLDNRKRSVPIPALLCSTLLKLTRRGKFTTADDLVLTSRTGNPISPDNLTARRLKLIGNLLEMPWLSWKVFHRTHISMSTSEGRKWIKELEGILPRYTGH